MSETTERKEDSQEEARSHPETRRGGTWRARERSRDCTLTTKGSYGTEHRVGDIFYQCPCLLYEQTHSGSPGSRDDGEVRGEAASVVGVTARQKRLLAMGVGECSGL